MSFLFVWIISVNIYHIRNKTEKFVKYKNVQVDIPWAIRTKTTPHNMSLLENSTVHFWKNECDKDK